MGFSDQLKKARIERGLTQQEVADELGIGNSTYCGYETGKRQPDVKKIKQLSEILNVSGDTLLETGFGEDEKTSPTPEQSDAGEVEKVDRLLTDLLVGWGYIGSGEDITELDADFLISWVRGLNAWFKQKGQSG